MALNFGYVAKIVTVETTFLYWDLEEEMYIECPQGMSNMKKGCCVKFEKKCIYSLLQAAWQYYKKTVDILKNSVFVGGSISPCFLKKSMKDIVYIALYVDNNLMIEDIVTNDNAIEALKSKGLVLNIVEGLQDYLSCKIKFSEDKKRAWLGKPH